MLMRHHRSRAKNDPLQRGERLDAGKRSCYLVGVQEERVRISVRTCLAAATLLLVGATSAAAALTGEFGSECVMGLALGKDIATDCSVNTVFNGKTYCFGNEQAKAIFLKRPEEFLTKAQVYYSSKGQ